MKPLPVDLRTQNIGSGAASCVYCADEGWVVVKTRTAPASFVRSKQVPPPQDARFEEWGPCPHCLAGYRVEMPAGPKPGPWGRQGFWRGRECPELELLGSAQLASDAETRRALEFWRMSDTLTSDL